MKNIHVSVEGTIQGWFKGEVKSPGHPNAFQALSLSYEFPFQAAGQQPAGRRHHHPVVITKEWGASSPQLLQACAFNEVLKSVEINLEEPDATGNEKTQTTIRLTNAVLLDAQRPRAIGFERTLPAVQKLSFSFETVNVFGRAIGFRRFFRATRSVV